MTSDDGVNREWWNSVHSRGGSALLTEIRRATLTGALPEGVEATTIWPSWPLDHVGDLLNLRAGDTLVDVACGNSDVGRWIARRAGAIYVGVDPSTEALRQARERAASERATFVEGHFASTGLDDACADGVLVVDAFFVVTDEAAALHELRRVLRPGGRLLVVGAEPPGRTWACDGLSVVSRTETEGWREAQRAFVDLLRARRDDLVASFGESGAAALLERPWEDFQRDYWHGVIVAERSSP